jgi:hypothetical protein
MRLKMRALVLGVSLVSAAQAWATVLPDACGNDSVKFDVKTEKGQPAPAAPPEGKSQIVFIENENHMIGAFMYATVRFGMDGAWTGANYSNSYFALNVEPGVHHLCASWQSSTVFKKMIDVASFTAEPGKVYYFAADVNVIGTGTGKQDSNDYDFNLSQLNEDEGKYRVKAWKLSTSKPNK